MCFSHQYFSGGSYHDVTNYSLYFLLQDIYFGVSTLLELYAKELINNQLMAAIFVGNCCMNGFRVCTKL
jgi:hypothetical protein